MNLTKYYRTPELTTWSPFTNLRDQLNRLFDFPLSGQPTEAFGDWSPALDAFEDKDKYIVSLEVPGMKKEDVKVEVTDGHLAISGERRRETEEKGKEFYRCERESGSFYRQVPLPEGIKLEDVQATFAEGVLEVSVPLPTKPEPKVRTVEIQESAKGAKSAA